MGANKKHCLEVEDQAVLCSFLHKDALFGSGVPSSAFFFCKGALFGSGGPISAFFYKETLSGSGGPDVSELFIGSPFLRYNMPF